MENTIFFTVVGCNVRVQCKDAETRLLLETNYHCLKASRKTAHLRYAVGREKVSPTFFIRRDGREPLTALDDSEFLFLFEKDMTIEVQKLRRDVYFVHAGVLEFSGKAFMLLAPSGGGKSITTWALLHHGFRYLSDELAPVKLETMEVYPYPHAICLKNEPQDFYRVPNETLYTSGTLHVPTKYLSRNTDGGLTPLSGIFFLRYRPDNSTPTIRLMSKAEAGARLFANALNPLAHPGDGLDGAIEMATKNLCYELVSADLLETCALVKVTLEGLFGERDKKGIHPGRLPKIGQEQVCN